MGRKKLKKERLEVKLEATLLQEVRRRVTLKYNDKPQSGALSTLVEILLRKWIEGEALVDPMRPISLSLNDLIESGEAAEENSDGKVPSDSPDSNGLESEASRSETS